jgi:hypothetical protein
MNHNRARERDKALAKKLKNYERNGNRWNNTAAREKRGSARRDATQRKVAAIDDRRGHLEALEHEGSTGNSRGPAHVLIWQQGASFL